MDISFRFLRLGLAARLVVVAAAYALGVLVQVLSGSALPGVPVMVAAWLLLALKPATNKPRDKGLEEWRAVSDAEVTRIADNMGQSKKLRARLAGPAALKALALLGIGAAGLVAAAFSPRLGMAALDACLFLVPGFFFGRVSVHVPYDFDMKLSGFLSVMDVPRPEGYALTPYLRFDKDEEGRDVPEDLRFMLEPRRKPADLVGVQFQSSINKGANGDVPYMYAVVLTKGKGGAAYQAFKTMRARGFEVEPGGDDEYGTVVVRQETDNGGYHTTDDDCAALAELMVKALGKVAA